MTLRIGSLCSGAGGLDMAVEQVFGGETVWHCEINDAASKVLEHRYPGVPNHRDLINTDWDAIEPIDILCAGWPCQPFSLAGKRKGAEDERAIWPYVAGAIRILRPRIVVLENVSAVLVSEFGRVANSLGSFGYDLQWTCLRASDVGAPHRRERLFVVATDPQGDGRNERWTEPAGIIRGSDAAQRSDADVELLPTPAAARSGRNQSLGPNAAIRPSLDMITELLPTPTTQDGTNCAGPSQFQRNSMPLNVVATLLPTPSASDGTGGRQRSDAGLANPDRQINLTDLPRLLQTPSVADADGGHATRSGARSGEVLLPGQAREMSGRRWGKYGPAIERWESFTGPAPSPTEPNRNGRPRLNPAFSEWLMGWPAGWVTGVPGVSRNDQLRIIGNGVVPQQAEAALRWLLSIAQVAA